MRILYSNARRGEAMAKQDERNNVRQEEDDRHRAEQREARSSFQRDAVQYGSE